MIVYLGLLAGVLTTGAWLPQLTRTWRRDAPMYISYGYLVVLGAGVLGWLSYGLISSQTAVTITNAVSFALLLSLLLLKARPRRPRESAEQ